MSQASKERGRGEESKKQGSSIHINKTLSGHSNDQQLDSSSICSTDSRKRRGCVREHQITTWKRPGRVSNGFSTQTERLPPSREPQQASGRQTLIQITDLFTDTAVWTVVAFHTTWTKKIKSAPLKTHYDLPKNVAYLKIYSQRK